MITRMPQWFFVSDLHGHPHRGRALLDAIAAQRPAAVLIGGDILPHGLGRLRAEGAAEADFLADLLIPGLRALRQTLAGDYPRVLVILGNDDPRCEEAAVLEIARQGLWEYIHGRRVQLGSFDVYGYACVPPTPFRLKDWERYDVSQYVEPGSVSPEEGVRTVAVDEHEIRHATIRDDLDRLVGRRDLTHSVFLFHAPPYDTNLDRAALDGRMIDHAPLDVHVGSVAIRRLIEERQPLITLHGHIHESARLTGAWSQQIGRTWCFSAAHDGPELALVRFDPAEPWQARREMV